MVTKGYRKGVYERVTKGINGRHRRVGQIRLYKKDGRESSTNEVCGGSARQCSLPVRNCGDLLDEGQSQL
jgi:hypothetical protein